MPDGDKYMAQQPDYRASYGRGYKLLDNVPFTKATGNVYIGPWCDISTLKNATVEADVTGLTGTINIEGTNDDSPISTTAGFGLCTAITSSGGFAVLTMPVRYIRARVTGFTAGSVNVQFHGVA